MLLGGTIAGPFSGPAEWEQLLKASRFKAVTAPFTCRTPEEEILEYLAAARRLDVVIAEVGIWNNLMDPDPAKAAENMAFAKGQLAMADRVGIRCCVNVSGTPGHNGWDAADPANYLPETYDRVVSTVREILDEVKPVRAFYSIEPMPWMVPDGPENYLQLIRDVDRPRFAAHMDFINMINCPRRYLAPYDFIEECFRTLKPFICSTHLKDTRMDPMRLTAMLEECSPGEGTLDFEKVLAILDRYLPADAPVLLEHMETRDEYDRSYAFVSAAAERAGIPV